MLSVQFASSLISSLPDRHAAMLHRHARYCIPQHVRHTHAFKALKARATPDPTGSHQSATSKPINKLSSIPGQGKGHFESGAGAMVHS